MEADAARATDRGTAALMLVVGVTYPTPACERTAL